eukprot:955413-Amphidinium_carterae.1
MLNACGVPDRQPLVRCDQRYFMEQWRLNSVASICEFAQLMQHSLCIAVQLSRGFLPFYVVASAADADVECPPTAPATQCCS